MAAHPSTGSLCCRASFAVSAASGDIAASTCSHIHFISCDCRGGLSSLSTLVFSFWNTRQLSRCGLCIIESIDPTVSSCVNFISSMLGAPGSRCNCLVFSQDRPSKWVSACAGLSGDTSCNNSRSCVLCTFNPCASDNLNNHGPTVKGFQLIIVQTTLNTSRKFP
jgi:hypothetical protein